MSRAEGTRAAAAVQESRRSTSAPPVVPAARRLRQPSWRDARLLIGVTLVLLSVVAGALVVSAADRTSPVYAAAHPLIPGQPVTPADLKVVGLRVTEGQSRYVVADPTAVEGRFVISPVAAGDLVPVSSVGDRSQVELRPVSVPVDPEVAQALPTGALVDVWVADPVDPEGDRQASGFQSPHRVAEQVVVGARATRRGALGSSTTTAVQVLVRAPLVPELIGAVNAESRITLVPLPTGARGAR